MMKTIKLLTGLTFVSFLATSCSFMSSYTVSEETAREALTNIIAKQGQPDFVYPTKGKVFKKYESYLQTISFGNTEIERDNFELTLEMDALNGYFHYYLNNLLTPMLNVERYFFLQDGIFYLTRSDENGKFYNSLSGLTGNEVNNIILAFASNNDYFEYVLGAKDQREGERILDYYSNGQDAYRDSLIVGSQVDIFSYNFTSKNNDNVGLEEILKNSLNYTDGLNHGENSFYSLIDINFDNDLLISSTHKQEIYQAYYYESYVIHSYQLDRNVTITNSSSVQINIPDISSFTLDKGLTR